MKRRIIKLTVFLAIGAMVTLALACGCAVVCGSSSTNLTIRAHMWDSTVPIEPAVLAQWQSKMVERGWQPEVWSEGRWAGQLHGAKYRHFGVERSAIKQTERAPPFGVCPAHEAEVLFTRAGWPLLCFEGQQWAAPSAHLGVADGAIVPRRVVHGSWSLCALVPLRPMWMPLVINSVIWSMVVFVAVRLGATARSAIRRKRGQCPACAYPVGQSPICTECGNAVRVRSP